MSKIDILLATYNGARYLPEQIASLDAQQGVDFHILVRDDGSTDGTMDILKEWRSRRPEAISILDTGTPGLGPSGNFSRLMTASDADYMLFCDQDDIWETDKVVRTVGALKAAERETGADRPILAFCDLAVMASDGAILNPSFRHFQGMDAGKGAAFHRLLLENVVTGCASGINAAAKRAAGNVPPEALMHDWWLALVCAGLGRVIVLPDALIRYRQHGGNAVGAKPWSARDAILNKLRSRSLRANQARFQSWMDRLYAQARVFEQRYAGDLAPSMASALRDFGRLRQLNPLARRMLMAKHGFRLSGVIRTIGLYLRA